MAWPRPGRKLLSEPMMVSALAHALVTKHISYHEIEANQYSCRSASYPFHVPGGIGKQCSWNELVWTCVIRLQMSHSVQFITNLGASLVWHNTPYHLVDRSAESWTKHQRVCYSKQGFDLKNIIADTAMSRRYTTWQSVPDASCNGRVTQIPQYTNLICHNALFCNRNVHMWTYFSNKVVHCRISVRCIVWFVRWVKTGTLIPAWISNYIHYNV